LSNRAGQGTTNLLHGDRLATYQVQLQIRWLDASRSSGRQTGDGAPSNGTGSFSSVSGALNIAQRLH
jgi:hypothetical protein